MEKIKIGLNKTLYEIENIFPISKNIMRITFADAIPTKWGDITLITSGGQVATTLTGYNTLYRDDGRIIYLSDDNSVYVIPAEPDQVTPLVPYMPTLAELKTSKKREISTACEQVIYKGIDVTLSDKSIGHFSLTEKDQLNLFGKQAQIAAGATRLEYHADGQSCRYFTPADMTKIVQAAMWHISYHTTYCNALNMWIAGVAASSDLQAITYGADVPAAYQSDVLKTYLKDLTGVVNAPA